MSDQAQTATFSALPLLSVALTACDQIPADVDDLLHGQRQAWVAIVFATATVEAFLNDLDTAASMMGSFDGTGTAERLATALEELEAARGTAVEKIDRLHQILKGVPLPRGQGLYPDFNDLSKIRNLIVHAKPERTEVLPNGHQVLDKAATKLHRAFKSRKLIGDAPFDVLTEVVATRAMARWSCEVARSTVVSIWGWMPPSTRFAVGNLTFGFIDPGPSRLEHLLRDPAAD